jgi:hypothetical protein
MSLWRTLAYIIDAGLIFFGYGLLAGGLVFHDPGYAWLQFSLIDWLIVVTIFILYSWLSPQLLGNTAGLAICRLEIRRWDGQPYTPGTALLRHLLKLIELTPLGSYAFLAAPDGRSLADRITGTAAYRQGSNSPLPPPQTDPRRLKRGRWLAGVVALLHLGLLLWAGQITLIGEELRRTARNYLIEYNNSVEKDNYYMLYAASAADIKQMFDYSKFSAVLRSGMYTLSLHPLHSVAFERWGYLNHDPNTTALKGMVSTESGVRSKIKIILKREFQSGVIVWRVSSLNLSLKDAPAEMIEKMKKLKG